MSVGVSLIVLATVLLVAAFVGQPLMLHSFRDQSIGRRQKLLHQKKFILEQIKGIEFDFDLGKIEEEAYQAKRKELIAEAADKLRQLEVINRSGKVTNHLAAIEKEAAAYREKELFQSDLIVKEVEKVEKKGVVIEDIAAPTLPEESNRKNFCTQCGHQLAVADRFCGQCGQKIEGK